MDVAETVTERSYRYPPRARWSSGAATVVCGGLAAGMIALQFTADIDLVERGQLLIFTVVFLALAVHAAGTVRAFGREVRLAHAGVGSGGELVPWHDVARVEILPLRSRMDVYAADGRRFLSLRPELDGFAAVQDYIIAHMQPRPCSPPCTIPLLSPETGAPVAVASLLLAVWFGPQRGPALPALFGGISLSLVLLYWARRRRIDVERDALVLWQGWRALRVPYRDISAVHLQARPRQHGGAVHYIVLERATAESVPIAGFRRGYNEAYHCIDTAWRKAAHPERAGG